MPRLILSIEVLIKLPASSQKVQMPCLLLVQLGKVAGLIGRSLTGKDQEVFFFGSQYLVKGKWRDAQIIPPHKNNGLLEKTWNGITGFPWLQQSKEQ